MHETIARAVGGSRRSSTCRPTSSPGSTSAAARACSATRPGARSSTTRRCGGSCPASRPACPSRRACGVDRMAGGGPRAAEDRRERGGRTHPRRLEPGPGHSRMSRGTPPLRRAAGLFALAVLMGACGGGGVSPTGPLATPAPTATAVPLPTILDGITGAIVPGAVASPPAPGRNERVMVTATGYLVREQLFALDAGPTVAGRGRLRPPDRVLLGGHGPGDRDAPLRGTASW